MPYPAEKTMKGYYDAVPKEVDVAMKTCPDCHGTGGEIEYIGLLPNCKTCRGTGQVEMTPEDIQGEIDAHVDAEIDEAKFRERETK
jgi:DnaJ-class molecular chaperone